MDMRNSLDNWIWERNNHNGVGRDIRLEATKKTKDLVGSDGSEVWLGWAVQGDS